MNNTSNEMIKSLKLKDINASSLFDGIEGEIFGKQIKIRQVGKFSYVVSVDGVLDRVAGVANVKKLLRRKNEA